MNKVRILVQTRYDGPKFPGDEVEVDNATAKRWCNNGIAEIIEVVEDETPEEIVGQDNTNTEETPTSYDELTAKQLYELCVEKGIEVEPKQAKQVYIELLTK